MNAGEIPGVFACVLDHRARSLWSFSCHSPTDPPWEVQLFKCVRHDVRYLIPDERDTAWSLTGC